MFNKLLGHLGYERKESRANQALITLGLGRAIWTEREYTQLAKAGYKTNSDYYAGVSLIAGAAQQIPWIVYTKEGGPEAKPGTPAADLLQMLKRPNDRMDGTEFIYHAIAYILLSGNRYIERVQPGASREESRSNPKRAPRELYLVRPDLIEIRQGTPENPVFGYALKGKPHDRENTWEPWEILHQKLFNPTDDWYGMAPIEAAGYPIDIGNEASALWKKLLQKGFPAGWIKPTGTWTEDNVRRFKSGLRQTEKENSFLFGEGIEDIKPFGFDSKQSGLPTAKLHSKRDIGAVLRVAAEMLGDSESKTYANYQEARRSLYTEAVIPHMLHLRNGLNNWLGPLFGNAFIDIDRDAIDALQEDREVAAKRVVLLFQSDLIKKNEARAELKYEAVPEDEDGYFSELTASASSSLNADGATQDGASEADPSGVRTDSGSGDSGNDSSGSRANGSRRSARSEARGLDLDSYGIKAFNLISEESKDSYWRTIEAHREPWVKNVAARVAHRFNTERKAVQRAFIEGGQTLALRTVDAQADDWHKLYLDIYSDVAPDFGRRLLAGLKSAMYEVKFEDDVFSIAVRQWLAREGAKRVVGVSETTKEKIRRELTAGTADGETIHQLSKRLQSMYSEFGNIRAERIARTEVISASNLGSQTAARSTNLPLQKEWISTLDERTREAHSAAHGQVRDMDQPYTVKGQSLMFPGDGSLGASSDNLIQCRCTESYRVKRS